MSQFGFTTSRAAPPRANAQLRQTLPAKAIPFDYAFQFPLLGRRSNKVQDIVEISAEGVFVALSIGYSLVLDEQSTARTFQPVIDQRTTLTSPVFVPIFERRGTGSPIETFVGLLLTGIPGTEMAVVNLSDTPPVIVQTVQGQPLRIGADGTVALPLRVDPQITPLLRVWDKTHNLLSELFEVDGSPTPVIGPNPTNKKLPTAGDPTVYVYGRPRDGVHVFLMENSTGNVLGVIPPPGDSVFRFEESTTFGRRTGRVEVALRVIGPNAQPIDKRLSPGDVLFVSYRDASMCLPFSMFAIPRPTLSTLTLEALAAGLEQKGADLTRGFRLNPDALPLATADLPLDQLAAGTRGRLFETGSVAAEEVSFLYSLDMGNTGREYQSKPIHNIAGLGIANGDRPMRPFAKPIVFEPRSFIRLQIEELSGPPGTLFIVLQGYKILGTSRIPG
jgi:hypothetical protein